MGTGLSMLVAITMMYGRPAPMASSIDIGEGGSLRIHFQSASPDDAAYSSLAGLRVFDQDDQEVFKVERTQVLSTTTGLTTHVFDLPELPDGLYRARVAAAFLLGEGKREHTLSTDVYLERKAGLSTRVSDSAWVRAGASPSELFSIHSTRPQILATPAADLQNPSTPVVGGWLTIYGWVSGSVRFYQNQGGWCSATMNCVGATYLQAEANTYQPFRDARIIVIDKTTGAQVGETVTDANGNYLALWVTAGAGQANIAVIVISEHKDGRFKVTTSDGSLYGVSQSTPPLTAQAYAQTYAPQITVGTSQSPNRFANLF